MYKNGLGVAQDYKEAVKLYRKSAEQGHADAQFNLGAMYDEGQSVFQDYREAVKWYRKSAEQGTAIAQFNLGFMYATGRGVTQEYVYAHMWFNIAASTGQAKAMKGRDVIAKKMSAADISKAQQLARECVMKQFKGC
jgi:TPR repeat protein